MLGEFLENVRKKAPLVHNITNYVTVNDCANILIAAGASPIMTDDLDDAAQITAICAGLNINIGTLNARTLPAMFAAGKRANELSHIVLLDPVGVGASALRTDTAQGLLRELRFDVIRGNSSEIKALALGGGMTKGVDADLADAVTESTLEPAVGFAKEFAQKTGAVVVITGALDIVADGSRACVVSNGHPMMGRITGSGCMLSALLTACAAANPGGVFMSAVAGVCAMGLAGELAFARMSEKDGNASYRNYLIDAVYNLTGSALEAGAKTKWA
ncbi:MAG: hydroxyethylthiazole kinase [Clostridiales bacterium]|jgi:hydroxyethylthiazole kinase|nr:hydroxyethylthiazole kinase [Clostridiales bacterium]